MGNRSSGHVLPYSESYYLRRYFFGNVPIPLLSRRALRKYRTKHPVTRVIKEPALPTRPFFFFISPTSIDSSSFIFSATIANPSELDPFIARSAVTHCTYFIEVYCFEIPCHACSISFRPGVRPLAGQCLRRRQQVLLQKRSSGSHFSLSHLQSFYNDWTSRARSYSVLFSCEASADTQP
jgi:hypothetical protein